jgi:hypothetical protein
MQQREMRYRPAPADHGTHQHGDAHPQTHQMADREQGEGEAEVVTAGRATITNTEIVGYVAGEDLGFHDDVEHRRDDRTDDDRHQAAVATFDRRRIRGARRLARPYFQHFGTSDTFRIRQVGVGHQRPAQGDGVHHAQNAASGTDAE